MRAPFEDLFITLALDALLITLLADWLGFVAFQSFFLAGPAPYADRQRFWDENSQDKTKALLEHVPSRLLVCLGFERPPACAADLRLCFATGDFFLEEALTVTLGVGVGAAFVTGDRRKADGEGIVIVAIESRNYTNIQMRTMLSLIGFEQERWLSCERLVVR